MKWRTEVDPGKAGFLIRPGDQVMIEGSCFAAHMGGKLSDFDFEVCPPSHGILFHPLAISRAMQAVASGNPAPDSLLVEHLGKWHSLSHHGSFSGPGRDELVQRIQEACQGARLHLAGATTALVTWGTAWAWIWKESGEVVGNCHRIPGNRFEKRLIPPPDISERSMEAFRAWHEVNPGLQVILTVSPVRHWREGAEMNQLSKASLIIAAHEIARALPFVHYFPAYELFMDDLRDYRFYAPDLIHPSEEGIAYTWEKFSGWCMDEETRERMGRADHAVRMLYHRSRSSGDQLPADSIRERIRRIMRGLD